MCERPNLFAPRPALVQKRVRPRVPERSGSSRQQLRSTAAASSLPSIGPIALSPRPRIKRHGRVRPATADILPVAVCASSDADTARSHNRCDSRTRHAGDAVRPRHVACESAQAALDDRNAAAALVLSVVCHSRQVGDDSLRPSALCKRSRVAAAGLSRAECSYISVLHCRNLEPGNGSSSNRVHELGTAHDRTSGISAYFGL